MITIIIRSSPVAYRGRCAEGAAHLGRRLQVEWRGGGIGWKLYKNPMKIQIVSVIIMCLRAI